jgi:hypothetical protein
MHTQPTPTQNVRGNLAEKPKSLVTVWFQAAKVVLADGGYRTIPGTSTETTIELPAYRMATHLERYVAQQYPGLTLVDWEVR